MRNLSSRIDSLFIKRLFDKAEKYSKIIKNAKD